ncbi:hypothetical protein C8R44DRAFT_143527 [Mycena epipterygia]|nr:hypothetical protein C8R44DRAFT_143527 [Mycena epipterygia]
MHRVGHYPVGLRHPMSDFWIYNAGFSVLQPKEYWVVIASCTLSPIGDIVVAVSISYCLWQLRKSEFNRTRSMADTLIIWTCETTLITSVAVMLQLILFLTRRDLAFMTLLFHSAQAVLELHVGSLKRSK